jgi:hypothetical protein
MGDPNRFRPRARFSSVAIRQKKRSQFGNQQLILTEANLLYGYIADVALLPITHDK